MSKSGLGAGDELSEGTAETRGHVRLIEDYGCCCGPGALWFQPVDRCGGKSGHEEGIEVSPATQGPVCQDPRSLCFHKENTLPPHTHLLWGSHTDPVPTCARDVSTEKYFYRPRETRTQVCDKREPVPVPNHMPQT